MNDFILDAVPEIQEFVGDELLSIDIPDIQETVEIIDEAVDVDFKDELQFNLPKINS
ncbi:hypothetical protein [Lactococcus garvieae]|uniref:hypothetical protein n=1 Tax=Lactococcus garvieae TaxID=1363 RepID=UPI0018DA1F24|nr:hypothetical protein [Lactococcus garvieae]QPS71417.1 hypothetical protein I6G50_01780 [Lactococcus garvieae]